MNNVASIQARMGSTRLPGKVLMHVGNGRILTQVYNRTQKASEVDEVLVTTGDRPENDAIVELCKRQGYGYLQGPEENLLRRHLDVARETKSEVLIRVTGDCPFILTEEINRVVREFRQSSARYTTNFAETMPVGTTVDVVDVEILEELHEKNETHPVAPLRDNPSQWQMEVTINERLQDYSETDFAVDTPSDYWTLHDATSEVGTDTLAVLGWLTTNT